MKILSSLLLFLVLILSEGCSNTRFLADDQQLYTGIKKIHISADLKKSKKSQIKNKVSEITSYKVNNSLFGHRVLPPIGLWVHNYMKNNESHKIRHWIYKKLAYPPVLISDVNPELRAKKIENDLFDMGYFNAKARSEIVTSSKNPRKAKISYFISPAKPFLYNEIRSDTLRDHVDTLMSKDIFFNQIRTGDQFNLDKLKSSRDDLSVRLQDSGYYYIVPELIDIKADTLKEPNKIDLTIGKGKQLPEEIVSRYTINNIVISNAQGSDTLKSDNDTTRFNDLIILSPHDVMRPMTFYHSLYFHKGDRYSNRSYQKTLGRLNNLGVFRTVNISYQPGSDTLSQLLDVTIKTVMTDNIHLDIESDLTSKSSGYFGPLFSAGVSNGNTFGGAERLKVGLTGGFEWQWGSKKENQIGTYSYEFGISSGLTLPLILLPFKKNNTGSLTLRKTSINADVSILNRTAYYKMLSIKTNLNYQWSSNKYIRHSLFPVYLNSIKLLATTPVFDSVASENIYIRKSFDEQFIFGIKYEFIFNNTINRKPNNFLFQGGITTSGNLADLIASAGMNHTERPFSFLNNKYSQFFKITTDLRYYRNALNHTLVLRLYGGIGIPYSNSVSLPYVEQFFSGGAYSIRGFTARYVGPGSFHTGNRSGYIDQSGDLKLESNIEYRFGMSKTMKGALFIDAGNIWLVNEDAGRPGSKFDLHNFQKQLAVGSGFGLRLDFGYFVIRADVGFPIRTPYKQENNKNWLFGTHKIVSGGLFYLAIGYPF